MISVVMPLYNKKSFVGEAVKSVIEQTFQEWELIVVNDGSTDGSEKEVLQFDDSRIKLFSQNNKGVSFARNRGIEIAQFEWVAFLDSDDWWESEFLETIVQEIEAHPTKHIFASGRNHLFHEGQVRYSHPSLPKDGQTAILDYVEVIGRGGLPPINSSNVVISKNLLLKSGGLKEEMRAHEDHEFWLRLCIENEVVFINKPLSNYRKSRTTKRRVFSYSDFNCYLNTLTHTSKALNESRLRYLKNYCNRFIPWSFWKNRSDYSTVEKKGIIRSSRSLISLPNYWILWILYRF